MWLISAIFESMKKDSIVYYLVSTRDMKNIRYIGVTCKGAVQRLRRHLYDYRYTNTYKDRWIKKELKEGFEILISVLHYDLTYSQALKKEILEIKKHREKGFKLVNTTDGGDGFRGKKSPEHIRKMTEARKNVVFTDEWRRNISLGSMGKKLSKEHKRKISESGKGRKMSREAREKMRIAATGRKHTEKTKERLRITSAGRIKSKEEIEKRISKVENPVDQFSLSGEFIKTWKGSHRVHKELGIDSSSIIKCCNEKRKSAGGYKWKYSRREN
jgi:hypothetical protein